MTRIEYGQSAYEQRREAEHDNEQTQGEKIQFTQGGTMLLIKDEDTVLTEEDQQSLAEAERDLRLGKTRRL